jgi:hypothetical protein
MFTIKVTDEHIVNWRTGADMFGPCRCPLATALREHLESLGTPIIDILNASSIDGSICYNAGGYWYRTYPTPAETQPARKFIYIVDFKRDTLPRKRVFHYTTPMPVSYGSFS